MSTDTESFEEADTRTMGPAGYAGWMDHREWLKEEFPSLPWEEYE